MSHDQSDAELCGLPVAQAPPVVQAAPVAPIPPAREDRASPTGRGRPEDSVRLDAESRRRIGRNLRLLYGDVLSQPLPARFAVLIADLSARNHTGDAS